MDDRESVLRLTLRHLLLKPLVNKGKIMLEPLFLSLLLKKKFPSLVSLWLLNVHIIWQGYLFTKKELNSLTNADEPNSLGQWRVVSQHF